MSFRKKFKGKISIIGKEGVMETLFPKCNRASISTDASKQMRQYSTQGFILIRLSIIVVC